MMLDLLLGAIDTVFFTAHVLLWALVSLAELLYALVVNLFVLLSSLTALVVPVLGSAVVGLFHVVVLVLEVTVNAVIVACTFLVQVVGAAMLYLGLLLSAVYQLCIGVFSMLVNLDWSLMFKQFTAVWIAISNYFFGGTLVVYNGIAYILSAVSQPFIGVFSMLVNLDWSLMFKQFTAVWIAISDYFFGGAHVVYNGIAYILSAVSQTFIGVFSMLVNLDWSLMFKQFTAVWIVISDYFFGGILVMYNGIAYILSALVALLLYFAGIFYSFLSALVAMLLDFVAIVYSGLSYSISGAFYVAQDAASSILVFGSDFLGKTSRDLTLISELMEVDRVVLMVGVAVLASLSILVLYKLVIKCIRFYLRWNARKNRRNVRRDAATAVVRPRPLLRDTAVVRPQPLLRDTAVARPRHVRMETRDTAAPAVVRPHVELRDTALPAVVRPRVERRDTAVPAVVRPRVETRDTAAPAVVRPPRVELRDTAVAGVVRPPRDITSPAVVRPPRVELRDTAIADVVRPRRFTAVVGPPRPRVELTDTSPQPRRRNRGESDRGGRHAREEEAGQRDRLRDYSPPLRNYGGEDSRRGRAAATDNRNFDRQNQAIPSRRDTENTEIRPRARFSLNRRENESVSPPPPAHYLVNSNVPTANLHDGTSKLQKYTFKKSGIEQARASVSCRDEVVSDWRDSQVHKLEKQLLKEKEAKLCVVCLDEPRDTMIRPCNHYCLCERCSKKLTRCPICTRPFARLEKIFTP